MTARRYMSKSSIGVLLHPAVCSCCHVARRERSDEGDHTISSGIREAVVRDRWTRGGQPPVNCDDFEESGHGGLKNGSGLSLIVPLGHVVAGHDCLLLHPTAQSWLHSTPRKPLVGAD
ncbi:hypothetical protein K461DRAFT_117396 [Myriangium duriaei CBS 260.36]|uniref:Uncharacterized protein n=1 Tax=Myriangium duriaei CBS 260.36 TaxID=1168546 RepID=A0A9P4J7N3_9PEZI|nr:hypothetical protein K461DRAFT_117396 [Myriangium duriaei CBS 260.36]